MTQIKLVITIFGDLLNPHTLSKTIGFAPTEFWFKGDVIPNRKNGITRKETCWQYSIGFLQTLSFEELSDQFIKSFSTNIDPLINYIRQNNLECKLDIVIEIINGEKPILSFDNRFMEIVSRMNGEVDIDLYIVDDDSMLLD